MGSQYLQTLDGLRAQSGALISGLGDRFESDFAWITGVESTVRGLFRISDQEPESEVPPPILLPNSRPDQRIEGSQINQQDSHFDLEQDPEEQPLRPKSGRKTKSAKNVSKKAKNKMYQETHLSDQNCATGKILQEDASNIENKDLESSVAMKDEEDPVSPKNPKKKRQKGKNKIPGVKNSGPGELNISKQNVELSRKTRSSTNPENDDGTLQDVFTESTEKDDDIRENLTYRYVEDVASAIANQDPEPSEALTGEEENLITHENPKNEKQTRKSKSVGKNHCDANSSNQTVASFRKTRSHTNPENDDGTIHDVFTELTEKDDDIREKLTSKNVEDVASTIANQDPEPSEALTGEEENPISHENPKNERQMGKSKSVGKNHCNANSSNQTVASFRKTRSHTNPENDDDTIHDVFRESTEKDDIGEKLTSKNVEDVASTIANQDPEPSEALTGKEEPPLSPENPKNERQMRKSKSVGKNRCDANSSNQTVASFRKTRSHTNPKNDDTLKGVFRESTEKDDDIRESSSWKNGKIFKGIPSYNHEIQCDENGSPLRLRKPGPKSKTRGKSKTIAKSVEPEQTFQVESTQDLIVQDAEDSLKNSAIKMQSENHNDDSKPNMISDGPKLASKASETKQNEDQTHPEVSVVESVQALFTRKSRMSRSVASTNRDDEPHFQIPEMLSGKSKGSRKTRTSRLHNFDPQPTDSSEEMMGRNSDFTQKNNHRTSTSFKTGKSKRTTRSTAPTQFQDEDYSIDGHKEEMKHNKHSRVSRSLKRQDSISAERYNLDRDSGSVLIGQKIEKKIYLPNGCENSSTSKAEIEPEKQTRASRLLKRQVSMSAERLNLDQGSDDVLIIQKINHPIGGENSSTPEAEIKPEKQTRASRLLKRQVSMSAERLNLDQGSDNVLIIQKISLPIGGENSSTSEAEIKPEKQTRASRLLKRQVSMSAERLNLDRGSDDVLIIQKISHPIGGKNSSTSEAEIKPEKKTRASRSLKSQDKNLNLAPKNMVVEGQPETKLKPKEGITHQQSTSNKLSNIQASMSEIMLAAKEFVETQKICYKNASKLGSGGRKSTHDTLIASQESENPKQQQLALPSLKPEAEALNLADEATTEKNINSTSVLNKRVSKFAKEELKMDNEIVRSSKLPKNLSVENLAHPAETFIDKRQDPGSRRSNEENKKGFVASSVIRTRASRILGEIQSEDRHILVGNESITSEKSKDSNGSKEDFLTLAVDSSRQLTDQGKDSLISNANSNVSDVEDLPLKSTSRKRSKKSADSDIRTNTGSSSELINHTPSPPQKYPKLESHQPEMKIFSGFRNFTSGSSSSSGLPQRFKSRIYTAQSFLTKDSEVKTPSPDSNTATQAGPKISAADKVISNYKTQERTNLPTTGSHLSTFSSGSNSTFHHKHRSRVMGTINSSATEAPVRNVTRTPSPSKSQVGPKVLSAAAANSKSSFVHRSAISSGSCSSGSSSSASHNKFRSRINNQMTSPMVKGLNTSSDKVSTYPNLVNVHSFLPSRPVKIKVTKEEIQAKKEEELRQKKEKEEMAKLRREELAKAKAEEKKLQREERQKKVAESRIASERERTQAKELIERKRREEEEAERKRKEEVMKRKREELEEKRRREREELRKRKEEELEAQRRRMDEDIKRRLHEEKMKLQEMEERKRKREEEERLANEEQRQREEKKKKNEPKMSRPDSYEITPGRCELPPQELKNPENYDISDLRSDEETDEEDQPKKEIPKWAQGSQFRTNILRQCYHPPDVDSIFAVTNPSVDLSEVFRVNRSRFNKRTSSAIWDLPPVSHKWNAQF